jgi:hypothetical protein
MENNGTSPVIAAAEKEIGEFVHGTELTVTEAQEIITTLKFPDQENFAKADKFYNSLHALWKVGEEKRLAYTAPLNKVLDQLNTAFKAKLNPLDSLKKKLKQRMDAYATDEMMWKRKEDARLAEEKRKADEEALAKATNLADQGKEKEADRIINQAIAEKPKAAVGATDSARSTVKTTWIAEVVDVREFLHAVANAKGDPLTLVEIRQSMLNSLARSLGANAKFPGVEFKEVASIGAGR